MPKAGTAAKKAAAPVARGTIADDLDAALGSTGPDGVPSITTLPPGKDIGTLLDPGADFDFLPLDEAKDILNVVIYGREGTGKTTDTAFMANLDGKGRVLIVNAEAGLKPSALRKRGIDTSNIVLWPNHEKGEKVTFDGLEALLIRLQHDLNADANSWKGVGFDSLTEITKVLLEDVVASQLAKAQRAGKDRDRFFIDRGDYGVMTEQVRLLVRRFRDLPCHFMATALERRDTDEDTGKVYYGPALTPALQTDVLGYVDLVLYVKAEELETAEGPVTEFRALTRPQGRFRAKDRFDATPRVLIDPTFQRIHAYVVGDLTEDNDPAQVESAAKHKAAVEHAEAEKAREAERKARVAKKTTPAARKTAAASATTQGSEG